MKLPYTVIVLNDNNEIETKESWASSPDRAADDVRGLGYVVAVISGQHENKFNDAVPRIRI